MARETTFVKTGQLRHRITVSELRDAPDKFGEPTREPSVLGKFWAQVIPKDGYEGLEALSVTDEDTHIITMRYNTVVKPEHIIEHLGRRLEITRVWDVHERHYQLMCTAREKNQNVTGM